MDRAKQDREEMEQRLGGGFGGSGSGRAGGGKRIKGASADEMAEFQKTARAKVAASEGE